jgi:hypothetical protein
VQDDVIAGGGRDVVVVAQRVRQGLHELEQPLPARASRPGWPPWSDGTASSNDVFPRQRFTNRSGGLALSCQRHPMNRKPVSRRMAGSRLAP